MGKSQLSNVHSFDTLEGDTVRIEGEDQTNLYVEYEDLSRNNKHGLMTVREGSEVSISQFMLNRTIFDMELSKANEPRTHYLSGCRFSKSDGQFEISFVNVE